MYDNLERLNKMWTFSLFPKEKTWIHLSSNYNDGEKTCFRGITMAMITHRGESRRTEILELVRWWHKTNEAKPWRGWGYQARGPPGCECGPLGEKEGNSHPVPLLLLLLPPPPPPPPPHPHPPPPPRPPPPPPPPVLGSRANHQWLLSAAWWALLLRSDMLILHETVKDDNVPGARGRRGDFFFSSERFACFFLPHHPSQWF